MTLMQGPLVDAPRRVRPLGTQYWVRLSDIPERRPSGLILTANLREQWCEGKVVAAGPGMPLASIPENGWRSTMWAAPGDRVLFRKQDLRVFDDREKLAAVRDEDLLALVDADGQVSPLNSQLLLEFLPRRTQYDSGIYRVEKKQQRPHCGRVLRYGPGRLRLSGPFAGVRIPAATLMGFEKARDLTGMVVHFGRSSGTLDVYSAHSPVRNWLLRAEDAEAFEED